MIHEKPREWDELLPELNLLLNAEVIRATGFSPFVIEHLRNPRLPADMEILPESRSIAPDAYVPEQIAQRGVVRKIVDELMKNRRASKGRKIPDMGVGSEVPLKVGIPPLNGRRDGEAHILLLKFHLRTLVDWICKTQRRIL